MRFLRRTLTGFPRRAKPRRGAGFAALALAVAFSACAAPTPTPTPSPTPTPVPIWAPPRPQYPELCDITHSYWIRSVDKHRGDDLPSPDGKYVAYQLGQKLMLEETATGRVQTLTGNVWWGGDVVREIKDKLWSPRSDQLVFREDANTQPDQYDIRTLIVDLRQGMDSPRRVEVPVAGAKSLGWSPDGAYLTLDVPADSSRLGAVVVWSVSDEKVVFKSQTSEAIWFVRRAAWSSDSRWLAFLWASRSAHSGGWRNYFLTTAEIATGDQITHPVVELGADVSASYSAARELDLATPMWSPDSRYVALVFGTRVDVFRPDVDKPVRAVDFTEIPAVSGPYSRNRHFPYVSWQADSRALLVWSKPGSATYQLDRLLIDPPGLEALMTVDQPPIPAPAPAASSVVERLAIPSEAEHHVQIELMNPDGSGRVPLIAGADDAGIPAWSPDGRTVAVVWTSMTGAKQLAQLSWANARGDERHTLEGDYTDIRDLSWSPDSQVLTLVGVRGEAYSVEMVDIGTGAHRVLLDRRAYFFDPRYNDSGAYYTVRWRSLSGKWGYDGFDRQGNRLYRVRINGDVGQSSRLFFSPDRRMAAVKVRLTGEERLVVARTDGSPPVTIQADLRGLGDPLWSPDSRLLAFTMDPNPGGPIMWHVVDTAGRVLWTHPPTGEGFKPIWVSEWALCPP